MKRTRKRRLKMRTNVSDTWHVIPINDLKDHDESEDCWCSPDVQYVGVGTIVTHHAMDERESYEQGRKIH
jgi:hypothetical protein